MLTEEQYLLICLQEECNEVAHRISKALRFGLDEVQEGQDLSNRERIQEELYDFSAVVEQLTNMGTFNIISEEELDEKTMAKIAKLEKYMRLSRELGLLEVINSKLH